MTPIPHKKYILMLFTLIVTILFSFIILHKKTTSSVLSPTHFEKEIETETETQNLNCTKNQVYHTRLQKCITPECQTNADCPQQHFCKPDPTQNDEACLIPESGICQKSEGFTRYTDIGGFIKSNILLTYDGAYHFCKSLNARMIRISDLACADTTIQQQKYGYCYSSADSNSSAKTIEILKQNGFEQTSYWLQETFDSCEAYGINLHYSYVYTDMRDAVAYALCRL